MILLLLLGLLVSLSPNMAYSKTYLVMYQAQSHLHKCTPHYTSPYKDILKMLFLENKAFDENPVERWDLVHRRCEEELLFGGVF